MQVWVKCLVACLLLYQLVVSRIRVLKILCLCQFIGYIYRPNYLLRKHFCINADYLLVDIILLHARASEQMRGRH